MNKLSVPWLTSAEDMMTNNIQRKSQPECVFLLFYKIHHFFMNYNLKWILLLYKSEQKSRKVLNNIHKHIQRYWDIATLHTVRARMNSRRTWTKPLYISYSVVQPYTLISWWRLWNDPNPTEGYNMADNDFHELDGNQLEQ